MMEYHQFWNSPLAKDVPRSEYRCQKCKSTFSFQRPGPENCPACKWRYIDCLNAEKVLRAIRKAEKDLI